MYQDFTSSQIELKEQISDFVKKELTLERVSKWDEENEVPVDFIRQKRKELGGSGLSIPEEFGGWGCGIVEEAIYAEELSVGCVGISLDLGISYLGHLPIIKGASNEQKKKWLEPVCTGDHSISFCLTEPDAGSDVPALSTTAVKKGDKYILNGTKQWITGAGHADAYTVFAVTNKNRGSRGISCFYVPRNSPGLSLGKKENKLGIRTSDTRQVIFENCEIDEKNLIGEENLGFIYALYSLNFSRPIIAAMSAGVSRSALNYASKYARERKQFGKSIASFQAVQHMLADMSICLETSREICYKAARSADNNSRSLPKYSAIAKAYCSEMAMKITLDAVQIYGGYGYTKEYPVEKLMRDAKILCIFEGTTQIQKNEIATYVIKEAASSK